MFFKPKRTPYYLTITAQSPAPVHEGFTLTLCMQPDFDPKGRLLAVHLLHHTQKILYTHAFSCDAVLSENSPSGGAFNETLCLSKICQTYFKNGKRVLSPQNSLLQALEQGACLYQNWVSFKAYKTEPHSLFITLSFRKKGSDP
jgi:hypothetical protein